MEASFQVNVPYHFSALHGLPLFCIAPDSDNNRFFAETSLQDYPEGWFFSDAIFTVLLL